MQIHANTSLLWKLCLRVVINMHHAIWWIFFRFKLINLFTISHWNTERERAVKRWGSRLWVIVKDDDINMYYNLCAVCDLTLVTCSMERMCWNHAWKPPKWLKTPKQATRLAGCSRGTNYASLFQVGISPITAYCSLYVQDGRHLQRRSPQGNYR